MRCLSFHCCGALLIYVTACPLLSISLIGKAWLAVWPLKGGLDRDVCWAPSSSALVCSPSLRRPLMTLATSLSQRMLMTLQRLGLLSKCPPSLSDSASLRLVLDWPSLPRSHHSSGPQTLLPLAPSRSGRMRGAFPSFMLLCRFLAPWLDCTRLLASSLLWSVSRPWSRSFGPSGIRSLPRRLPFYS